jgi:hypothetical protein
VNASSNGGRTCGYPTGTCGEWVIRTGPQLREEVVETLTYTEEFSAAPHVVFCKDSQLKFRLEGRRPSRVWRDWLVLHILPDLREQFPEIQETVLSVRNCDQPVGR